MPYSHSKKFLTWKNEKSQRPQERPKKKNHPGKGMPTPGNHGAGSTAPRVSVEAQTRHPISSSPLCSRTVPWSKYLFSPTNILQLDGAESFISEQGVDILASYPASDFAPLVQCHECSRSTPLSPIQQLHPTRPLHNLGVYYQTCPLLTPLSNTPIKRSYQPRS